MTSDPIPSVEPDGYPDGTESQPLTELDRKILDHFPGLVVRKDLTAGLKQNAVVPTYVLEYLLGQHCATEEATALAKGLDSVRQILTKHYVHRKQSELIKSTIKEKGRHKVIDKVSVELNDKGGYYQATFTNLGLKQVPIGEDFVRRHQRLLVGGIWCITDVKYELEEDPKASPWHIDSLKPIQVSGICFDDFVAARKHFTTDEWMGVILQSVGLNPDALSRRTKLLQLMRLIPFCERNYNLIELGPKGTGKSHVYAEFSPHGILISGGEVTVAKLFVNNRSGNVGLVGYWDCICFDEFAGKDKKVDKSLVDIMKNYMANKSFSRGIEQLSAEASMVFMGNTKKSVPFMLKHGHFFDQLPDKYIDSAFLDRLHAYIPGWESPVVCSELFTSGYGFIVDYFAEILKTLRDEDFTGRYHGKLALTSELSTRDQTGVEKTFSGLMKLIYPTGDCTEEECEELFRLAMECRRRVREHLLRIDTTFEPNTFAYERASGGDAVEVLTPEELQYPEFCRKREGVELPDVGEPASTPEDAKDGSHAPAAPPEDLPEPKHLVIPDNAVGWSYERMFGAYLKGARRIEIEDPYVRMFFQIKNLMDLLVLIHSLTPDGEEVEVSLLTKSDENTCVKQEEMLNEVINTFDGSRVSFSWDYNHAPSFHARSIVTDTGWKISIDRGLDMFEKYENSALSLASNIQEVRRMKVTAIHYTRVE